MSGGIVLEFEFDGGSGPLVVDPPGLPGQDDTVIRRMAETYERKGTPIILRRTTSAVGGPNPPVLVNPRLDGAVLAGVTQIAIRADQAVGRIVAGDKLNIGASIEYTVAAPVTARTPSMNPTVVVAPGFTAVTLTAPLEDPGADGATITMRWSADQTIYGSVASRSSSLAPDQRVDGDFRLIIPAFGVLSPPKEQGAVSFGGVWYRIVQVIPNLHRDQVSHWVVGAK